ncbi:MAG: site-specific DNA-methyltransferase [Actinomycetota bacterium]|nr:site-specific DNA-methyltransferase [Actinomycetota bacterium]
MELSRDRTVQRSPVFDKVLMQSAENMSDLADNSVALTVTSPPYHVGKDYDGDASFAEYLALLERVFREVHRVLEPGGRAVVNVANLGRRPYIPLSHLVTERMLRIGFLMRGEVIWRKARGASGNCAWGSWRSAANPVVRDYMSTACAFEGSV